MPSRIGTTLLMSSLIVAAAAPCRAQTITDAYQAYVAGRSDAITRSFPDVQAFRNARDDLQRTLRLWVRSWKPSQAAFLLELSLVGFDRGWTDAPDLLSGTRNLVVSRPTPPGASPEEDAFERAFHRAAVTFFLGRQMLNAADAYMNALAGRVDLVQATVGRPRLIDPWMAFARGMLADIRTAPALRGESDGSSSLAIPASDSQLRRLAQLAINELERVRAAPEVAGEAAARRALLLLRLDRPDEALAALDESDAATGDDTVRYYSALFRGRTLERLARTVEAATAYERATTIVRGAQTPAVALASLWQRHDRPAEALSWARRAMTTPAGSADPWWLYWRGDLRHAGARLAVLRATTP
jgi:hypothetical protein